MSLFRKRKQKSSNWTPHSLCDLKDRAAHICLAVDANGKKYTEHVGAGKGDPWMGAHILMPHDADRLRAAGLLPLREITS